MPLRQARVCERWNLRHIDSEQFIYQRIDNDAAGVAFHAHLIRIGLRGSFGLWYSERHPIESNLGNDRSRLRGKRGDPDTITSIVRSDCMIDNKNQKHL